MEKWTAAKKSFKLVWWYYQLLFGFLAKGHFVPSITSVANDKGDNEMISEALQSPWDHFNLLLDLTIVILGVRYYYHIWPKLYRSKLLVFILKIFTVDLYNFFFPPDKLEIYKCFTHIISCIPSVI